MRELENLARRLAALYPQDVITAAVIDAELAQPAVTSGGNAPHGRRQSRRRGRGLPVLALLRLPERRAAARPLPPHPQEIELPLLTAALAATRGNQIRAADLLGLNRNTLRKKIRDLDIQVYRSGG